jgi:hypothetical protein
MHYGIGVYGGSVHTCILTGLGEVYTCGKSEYTGHGGREDILIPKMLVFATPIRQISVGAGGYHTIALSEKGEVYTWGQNRVGQLGQINHTNKLQRTDDGAFYLPQPEIVEDLPGDICQVHVSA